MNINKKVKGFTIIEVVLVLAIAGLIFMMVFLALPALQRSQRDSQRKSDVGRAITAIGNYSAANRGAIPLGVSAAQDADFVTKYLLTAGDAWFDPSGASSAASTLTNYALTSHNNGLIANGYDDVANQNVVWYTVGATCDTGGAVKTAGNRKVALRIVLESGGVYCANN